jgi:hypothetical protein
VDDDGWPDEGRPDEDGVDADDESAGDEADDDRPGDCGGGPLESGRDPLDVHAAARSTAASHAYRISRTSRRCE